MNHQRLCATLGPGDMSQAYQTPPMPAGPWAPALGTWDPGETGAKFQLQEVESWVLDPPSCCSFSSRLTSNSRGASLKSARPGALPAQGPEAGSQPGGCSPGRPSEELRAGPLPGGGRAARPKACVLLCRHVQHPLHCITWDVFKYKHSEQPSTVSTRLGRASLLGAAVRRSSRAGAGLRVRSSRLHASPHCVPGLWPATPSPESSTESAATHH